MRTPDILDAEPTPNLAGEKMRLYRRRLCETQGEFGARYGLKFNAISRYERGERFPELKLALQLEKDGVCECADWARPPLAAAEPQAA